MVADAGQDVCHIGFGVVAAELRAFDDRHGFRESFTPGIGPGEEPILPTNHHGLDRTLGRVVVDGHTPVRQKQAEGVLSGEAITEGFGQIALARDAQKLLFGPGKEGLNLWSAQLLPRRIADVST